MTTVTQPTIDCKCGRGKVYNQGDICSVCISAAGQEAASLAKAAGHRDLGVWKELPGGGYRRKEWRNGIGY